MTSPEPVHPLVRDPLLRGRLLRLARHWLREGAEAEDLVQDAYLRTATGALPEAGQEAWLVTVLRHLCVDHWRRKERYQGLLQRMTDGLVALPEQAANDDPEPVTARAQRLDRALEHLVRALPAEDVAALLLFDVFGFTHAEIAELAGRSEAASRQRLRRLLQRLRKSAPPAEAESVEEDADQGQLFALCRQAIARHEASGLIAVLRASAPQVMLSAASGFRVSASGSPAPHVQVVQTGGQLALMIRIGDGPALVLPLGEAEGATPLLV